MSLHGVFDENPNAGRESGEPHHLVATLNVGGWNRRPTPNGVHAWRKPWEIGNDSFAEGQRVRAYATTLAKELAGPVESPCR